MRAPGRGRVVAALTTLFGAAVVVGACTDATSAPNAVVAIAFDSLPYPALVAHDTLRDSTGRAAPLKAVAYNSDGQVIVNPSVRYLALDTGVVIDAQGYLVANTRTSGTVRVVATANFLQSVTRTLTVTRAPSKLAATSKLVDTLRYASPDVAATNTTSSFGVTLTGDSSGVALPVVGFIVSYRLVRGGQTLTESDTTVSLWDDASHLSTNDTTSTDGSASRKLRIWANRLPVLSDSVEVYASARYRGVAVAGSPVRFVIHLRRKSAR
jgi:hypothetical protein